MPLAKGRRYNMPECNLSIVVISKNEEKHIAKCLASVFAEIKDLPATEVILVDSRSADRTIEIASKYNIKIAVIDKKHKTTPGLGRLIGTQLAKGKLIFFIDGDKVLTSGWLKEALSIINKSETIAGVTGNIEEGVWDRDGDFQLLRVLNYFNDKYQNGLAIVSSMSGTGLLKKSALETASGYDPFMPSCEDTDLFLRIEKNKSVIAWIPNIMCRHTTDTYNMPEIIGKIFSGYYLGLGYYLRKALENKTFWKSLSPKALPLSYVTWLLLGIFCFCASFLTKSYFIFFLWLIMNFTGLVIIFIKIKQNKKNKRFIPSLTHIFGSSLGLICGFFITPKRIDKGFNYNYTIIK